LQALISGKTAASRNIDQIITLKKLFPGARRIGGFPVR
jgi:hypothetical protein